MRERAARLGVSLRPHQKTAKSVEVARRAVDEAGAITVSTAREVREFAAAGFGDITWAVGATAARVASLGEPSCRLSIVVDDPVGVSDIAEAWRSRRPLGVLAEIDCGGRRGGLLPDDGRLIDVAAEVSGADGLEFRGVLTHAGHSYAGGGRERLATVSADERDAVVEAAERLRAAGHACDVVSVGSTPTAIAAEDLTGVTEMRPGVYALFDLTQEALGVCTRADIAGTVLTTVVGRTAGGELLVDAGALALSLDTGPHRLGAETGFGLVTDVDGAPLPGGVHRVTAVHQEHGFVGGLDGDAALHRPGTRVRVWPNHACLTAAPYSRYVVVEPDGALDVWPSITGW